MNTISIVFHQKIFPFFSEVYGLCNYYVKIYYFQNYHKAESYSFMLNKKGYTTFDIFMIMILAQIIFIIAFLYLKALVNQWKGWKATLIDFCLTYIPSMRKEFEKKLNDTLDDMKKEQDKFTYDKKFSIPDVGIKKELLYEKAQKLFELDNQKATFGKISGGKYYEEDALNQEITNFSRTFFLFFQIYNPEQFLYHNLMHFDLYVSIRQIETELIAITSQLFHGDSQNAYGVVTQGGSESLCMGILAARNYCSKIAPCTIHPSVDKACAMFKIKLTKIDVNQQTFQIDLKKMKRAINRNTILLIGSCPNYPHGIIDPLEEIAAIAKQKNILFHVDCCLGSLNLPFAVELGQPLPKFDFSLDGVTSISIDHHKHGLAPKGVSIILYKTCELRRSQYFTTLEWPGGVYGTSSRSRSGAPTAGAWFALMYLGRQGYKELALKIFNALNFLKKEISVIPELEMFGNPIVNTLAFRSKNEKELPIYSIKKALTEKGWFLTGIQKPSGIHISLTQSFCKSVENFIKDLQNSIQEVKNNPQKYATNSDSEVYGTTQALPVGEISQFAKILEGVIDTALKI